MTPDEQQLLNGLFDRIRAASTGPRDAEAENFINSAVHQNPGAPYVLAQTVLVQEQALAAANQKIIELQQQAKPQAPASFLGGLGQSLFGSSQPQQQPAPQQTNLRSGYAPSYPAPQPQQSSGPNSSGPWGAAPAAGGGFLSGALHTAAGVAGGMLLAEGIRGLFSGGGHGGMMSGIAGPAFGAGTTENVTNNYYGDNPQNQAAADYLQDQDQDQDAAQDASDYSSDSSSDDSSY